MIKTDFEKLLTSVTNALTDEVQKSKNIQQPAVFESRVRTVLAELAAGSAFKVDFAPHPHIFPDIVIDDYGIEVKVSSKDSWRSVANSVFEGTRDPNVRHIYVLFGKMGGRPEVKWGRYEECVMHVRTSHVPRFEVEINPKESLFSKLGVSYEKFRQLASEQKMGFIRNYARARLKEGERLWWLEDRPEEAQEHSLPLQVRLYTSLSQEEKRGLRAESALLCPGVVKPSRSKKKYDDAAMYLITYRGVLCSQARDLFSAGSVALRSDATRGGNYTLRALQDIQGEMKQAARDLEDALFVEYWGISVPPSKRIREWLKRADKLAKDWKPSDHLFRKRT